MFRQLADSLGPGGVANPVSAETVLTSRPSELSEFLEACWLLRDAAQFAGLPPAPVPPPGLQIPANALDDVALRTMARPVPLDAPPAVPIPPAPAAGAPPPGAVWPHLSYALMLEQTRMVVIFRRILEMYITGVLPVVSWQTRNWLRATEELFFASPRLPSVYSLESHLRMDSGARRRNSYFRLLGIDLSHGTDDGRPYPYVKPEAANRDFAAVFEVLLGEVWRAYTNRNNGIGPDTTDDLSTADLLRRLNEMLTGRRLQGALAREEFEAVALMSWLDLTLNFNTAIIGDLAAQGSSAPERLMRIAQRASVAPHARTDSYFQMAIPLSTILRGIESGAITGIPGAQSLYLGLNQADMLTLITHWSIAAGRNIKDPAVRVSPGGAVLPAAPLPRGNGTGAPRPEYGIVVR